MLRPQSMPTGERNVLRSNDSASLWNCTLSPGWNQEEVSILRLALMKFGIGNWSKIVDSQCLVGKTVAQMNLQTQRMLGQQSTADPLVIGKINSQKQGPHIKRKNNFIVNTGGKISKEEKNKRIQENKKLYGLSREVINSIVLPTAKPVSDSIIDMETELKLLKSELAIVREKIQNLRAKKGSKRSTQQSQASLSLGSSDANSLLGVSSPISPPARLPKIILRLKPRAPSPESEEVFEKATPKSRAFTTKRIYISESDEYYDSEEIQKPKSRKKRNAD